MMNRGKQLKLNTVIGLLSHLITLICGFIVPKLILSYYGTEVNGLVSSITHFLSFISLAECGMGVVVQSSLYKPLSERDDKMISRVIVSADHFFARIAAILSVYVLILLFAYPIIVNTSFDGWYTVTLIGAISISTFVQHFICMSYRLLLIADQKGYVQLLFSSLTQVINTIISVILVFAGASIQLLKLCTSIVLLLQPLLLVIYVKKHYRIDKKIRVVGEPIKQKWNGIAQHIAYVVLENTPTVVLTVLSTISSVSVYNVYYLVVSGIKGVVTSAVSGMQSLLGNMYAKGEEAALNTAFTYYEWIMHVVVVFLYTCTAVLIVPFVRVYTSGITDANYIFPVFGIVISVEQMMFCLRLPYNTMIFVAGHYKQTQCSALIEAAINIAVSVLLVFHFNLTGVALGMLAAMAYRTIYLVFYLQKNIMMRPVMLFVKHIVVDTVAIGLCLYTTAEIHMYDISYLSWIVMALKVATIVGTIVVSLNVLCYMDLLKRLFIRWAEKRL